METPSLRSLELSFSTPGAFGVLEEIVVGYAEGPPRRRVRGTHWKSNARTDALAAAVALLVLREDDGPALLDSRNGAAEAKLCARLHDLWFSPRKRIESHWLDAVFDEGTEGLASPLAMVLTRSGRRESASFRLAEGLTPSQVRFTRGGQPCEPEQLWAFVGLRFGIARPLPGPSARLPVYRTSLVGREADLERLPALLRERRLVTLIGPSGVGKTRLAIEIAARANRFAEGTRLVDLSVARTREQAIHRVRELVEATPGDPRSLSELLRGRAMLLLLDNCETVLAAAAEIAATILEVASESSILATALEPLGAHGETCYRLLPLALPPAVSPASEALLAPSVRLFLDRTAAAISAEAAPPNAEDVRSILAICRNVGGLPLGIELAAAAARRFSLADVEKLLLAHLDVVEGDDRALAPRHASLHALFSWTRGLLSAQERKILACLAVFPYDWSLDAACAICRAVGIGQSTALRAHARLVDLSIVQLDAQHRFTMLPSLRCFAHDSLSSSSFAEGIRHAFQGHFLSLAESGGETGRLLTEAASLRQAALLACEDGRADIAARFVDALYPMWLATGTWIDGVEICHRTLALPGTDRDRETRLLLAAAGLEYRLGEIEASGAHYARAHALLAREAERGDGFTPPDSDARRAMLAHVVHGLGAVAFRTGHLDEAESYFSQAAAIWSERGDEKNLLNVSNNLAAIAAAQGRLEQAGARFAGVAELASRAGDRRILASALMNCGLVHWREGQSDVARDYFERSLEIFREMNDLWGEANVCNSLAVLALGIGDREQCAAHHARSLDLRVKLGDRAGIVASLEGFASHAAASRQPVRALRLLAAARAQRAATQLELTADNREGVDRALAESRAQISAAESEVEERIGASFSLEEAIAFALGVRGPSRAGEARP